MLPSHLLRELIAIPSINPAFGPPDPQRTGEGKVASFLADYARRLGLECEFQDVMPGRKNLLAKFTPAGKVRQRVLLAPHLDTVGASNAQLEPRTSRGRLYGRGACDTKGSVAAMLTAIGRVVGGGHRPQTTEVIFAGLVDEENGQAGSRALAKTGFKASLAIVGEPTGLQVVTAHKGDLWLAIETRGRAAHGATPDCGRNAVHAMARVVDLLETGYAQALRQRRHPLLGHATINVGSIAGGTQPNIVPDHCVISADRRTLPGETEKSVIAEIRTLFRLHGLKASVMDTKAAPCLPMETDPRLPLVARMMAMTGQTEPLGVHFFCDASVLAQAGIPSVVFGPGDIAQAHTAEEWISLRSLDKAADMLTRFIESLP